MPVITKRKDYCVCRFRHTIIPVVDSLFIGYDVAEAFVKRFEIDVHHGSENIVSRKVNVNKHPTELHFVFLKNIGQIPTAVTNVFSARKIGKNDEVGVILQGSKSAAKMLKGMADNIDKNTGAYVCVW